MSSCTAMHFHFFCTYTLLPEYILFFFFNDTATTEIYTLSLHDALPIWLGFEPRKTFELALGATPILLHLVVTLRVLGHSARSEEHTSELQSQSNLVCRLLLEKKKKVEIRVLLGCHVIIMSTYH